MFYYVVSLTGSFDNIDDLRIVDRDWAIAAIKILNLKVRVISR